MRRLEGRVAVITGGGGGIGRAIAESYTAEGAKVVLVDKSGGAAESAAAFINDSGGIAYALEIDVTAPDAPESITTQVISRFGALHILVNNAGGSIACPFVDTSLELWDRMMDVNLRACFRLAQAAAKSMISQPGGRIINIASHSGLRGSPGHAAYAAAKGGLIALTRVMSTELGPHGVTVNAIAPGPIDVPRTTGPEKSARRDAWKRATALKRSGTPTEVAWAALFLAAPEAAYVTGQVVSVDGGFTSAGLMV